MAFDKSVNKILDNHGLQENCCTYCVQNLWYFLQRASKRVKFVREIVKEVAGLAPYERRVTELLKVGRDKRALKLCKRKVLITQHNLTSLHFEALQEEETYESQVLNWHIQHTASSGTYPKLQWSRGTCAGQEYFTVWKGLVDKCWNLHNCIDGHGLLVHTTGPGHNIDLDYERLMLMILWGFCCRFRSSFDGLKMIVISNITRNALFNK